MKVKRRTDNNTMTEPTFSLEDCEIAGELCQALDMEGEYKFDLEVVAEIVGHYTQAHREKIEKKKQTELNQIGMAGNTLKARLIHLRHEAQINPDMHLSDYFTSVCGEFVDREIKQAEEAGL